MTVTEQLQTRITWIDTELERLQGVAVGPETAQVSGDGPDKVQLPTLSAIYNRIKDLEQERDAKQAQLSRLSGATRATSRAVRRC